MFLTFSHHWLFELAPPSPNLHFESYLPGGRPATNSNWNSVGTENEEKNTPSFVGDDICLICLICLIICLLEFQPLESFGFWIYSFSAFFLLSSVKQLALASFPWIGSESFRVIPSPPDSRSKSEVLQLDRRNKVRTGPSHRVTEFWSPNWYLCQVHRSCEFKRILSDIWFGWCEILTGNWLDVTQIGGFLQARAP